MKFRVIHYEDFFTAIAETIIECADEKEINDLVDKYCKDNLAHLDNIVGANWQKIEK